MTRGPSGGGVTSLFNFNATGDFELKDNGIAQGNFIAPNNKVKFKKGFFKGIICAKEIEIKETTFVPHDLNPNLPPVVTITAPANGSTFTQGTPVNFTGTGWSIGTQMGDKEKNVELSVAYFELGANATPANFVDSDLFDGRTNGRGWHFKIARQIFENTELKADLLLSEPLDDDIFGLTSLNGTAVSYVEAVENHDRLRFRIDVVVKW